MRSLIKSFEHYHLKKKFRTQNLKIYLDLQCVPKKWGLGFAVNFIEMTYKLVSRSETVQIK